MNEAQSRGFPTRSSALSSEMELKLEPVEKNHNEFRLRQTYMKSKKIDGAVLGLAACH